MSKPVTTTEVKQIKELWDDKKTMKQIAEELDKSIVRVRNIIYKHTDSRRLKRANGIREQIKAGKRAVQIEKMGYNIATIYRAQFCYGRVELDEFFRKSLIRLIKSGQSHEAILAYYDYTECALRGRCKKLFGMTFREFCNANK